MKALEHAPSTTQFHVARVPTSPAICTPIERLAKRPALPRFIFRRAGPAAFG
ncbi:MAG: hypothetical protein IPK83_16395 [Planctomycetes bacterium]|nr:hypothetical protein [Planctomycetota bacterium]